MLIAVAGYIVPVHVDIPGVCPASRPETPIRQVFRLSISGPDVGFSSAPFGRVINHVDFSVGQKFLWIIVHFYYTSIYNSTYAFNSGFNIVTKAITLS